MLNTELGRHIHSVRLPPYAHLLSLGGTRNLPPYAHLLSLGGTRNLPPDAQHRAWVVRETCLLMLNTELGRHIHSVRLPPYAHLLS